MKVAKTATGYAVIDNGKKVFSGPRKACITYKPEKAAPKNPAPKKAKHASEVE